MRDTCPNKALDCLQGRQAVLIAKNGQQVVAKWVRYVLGPVGIGALSGHQALDGKALQTRLPVKTGVLGGHAISSIGG